MAEYIGICNACGAERYNTPCPECGSTGRIEYIRTDEPRLTDIQEQAMTGNTSDPTKQPLKRTEQQQFQVYRRGPTIWPWILLIILIFCVLALLAH